MDDLIKGDLVTNEKMGEGELLKTPEFYSSLTDRPNVNRLRSLDIKVNVPYISEYVEFVAPSTSAYSIRFKEKYKATPLVLGLYETTAYTGERVTKPIYTDGLFLRVNTEGLTVGTFFGLTAGDKFRLRVYNLDYFAVATNIRPSYVGSNFSFNFEADMIGEYKEIAFTTVPTGWLECNGQAVSRTTYADLFNLLGTTFGAGDGSTTFNIPNRSGKVGVPRDATQTEFDTLGETGGAKTHTLSVGEMPSHTHTQNAHGHNALRNSGAFSGNYSPGTITFQDNRVATLSDDTGTGRTAMSNVIANTTATNQNTGGGGAHNNLQPYMVFGIVIIKATN